MKKIIGTIIIASLLFSSIPIVGAINNGINETNEKQAEDMTEFLIKDPNEANGTYPSSGTFMRCKIEASGFVSKDDWPAVIRLPNMWKTFWFRFLQREEQAFVSFWRIVFDPDAEITIYSEDNDEILWDHQEQEKPQLILVGYSGIYSNDGSEDDSLHVSINGKALLAKTRLIKK
jgi:hypothetical protein